MKIFLDANVIVAACGSAHGASRYLFDIARAEPSWQLFTNAYAINEARRNVDQKLSAHRDYFIKLLVTTSLVVVHPAPTIMIEEAMRVINKKDAPVLAGAWFARADTLCTLDAKDFHIPAVRAWCRDRGIAIVYPKDLVVAWRAAAAKTSKA